MILFADPEFTAAYPLTWVRFLLPTPVAFNAIVLGQLILGALPLY